jgi:predicted alpha/beta hydrolase family esterase
MQKRVLLLHGWGGSDTPHWQSWLASQIAKDYGSVSFLKFSNFDFPDKEIWKKELLDELDTFKPNIVVCHSLANTLWFHLCNEESMQDVEKLFLVAPPSLNSELEELKSFFPVAIPTNLHAKEVLLVSSTNDPYMTQDEALNLQSSLDVEMALIKDAGHINAQSGYGEWKWILNQIDGENSEK